MNKRLTEITKFLEERKNEAGIKQLCGAPDIELTGSARPQPKEIAQRGWDNGHVPTFLKALCELLMCSDPWPASPESETEIKHKANVMARNLGFSDWIEAYHGL